MYWYLKKANSEISLGSGDKYKDKFSVSLTRRNQVEEWSESILTISSLQVDDWMINYTCIASNDEGSREKIVHVKGFGKNCVDHRYCHTRWKTQFFIWNAPNQRLPQNRLDQASIHKK